MIPALLVFLMAAPVQADGGGADVVANPHVSGVDVYGSDSEPGAVVAGGQHASSESVVPSATAQQYEWQLACAQNYPGTPMVDCVGATVCPDPGASLWVLWSRPADGSASWTAEGTECREEQPPLPGQPARPTVTAAMVEEAVRRMGLPSLPVHVQPAEATLVNFDTIFFTEPVPFDRSVTLVGYDVRVLAEPVSYGWSFGDGSSMTTQVPGAPYPAKDVVHRYDDAHVTVQPSVDVTYEVTYTVDGGEVQQLGTTLTAQGPSTGLRIREAAALLAGAD